MINHKEKIVDNLANLIYDSYGSRLNEKEKEEIRKSIVQSLENVDKLKKVKIENGDEPYNIFIPYRKEKT
ncbi:hypothetical protein JW865_07380 [Candidatus Bathyarchaeota archaeon]|nr:hypothetical protein [Candidatus Bathyarchaeota archaeon]